LPIQWQQAGFSIFCSRYKPTNQVQATPTIYAPVNHGYNSHLIGWHLCHPSGEFPAVYNTRLDSSSRAY